MTTPVGLGVMAGLLLGKPLGIVLLCWGAVKMNVSAFPYDMDAKHLATVGVLAGIGRGPGQAESSCDHP
jgi:NhaA family Na+:H+ antiporter